MSVRRIFILLSLVWSAGAHQAARAQTWVVWPDNGHSYAVISAPAGIDWDSAEAAAQVLGGHLASVTSAAENQFVFSLIDHPEYWKGHLSFTGVPFNLGPW